MSADTHSSQISRHPDYLAEMHKKSFYRHWSSFVLQHSSASVFPVHGDSAQSSVRACLYLNLRLHFKTVRTFDHVSRADLLVFHVSFSEGFSLHLSFLPQQWQHLQGFNSVLSASLCLRLCMTAGQDTKYC